MAIRYINNWITQLTGILSAAGNILPVPAEVLARLDLTGGGEYVLTLADSLNPLEASAFEIVKLSSTGLVRGLESTTPRQWPAGTVIYCSLTAGALAGLEGIVGTTINGSGHLILSFTDGSTKDAGYVLGPKGDDGEDGTDGLNGTNGVGINGATVNGSGHLVLTYTSGSTVDAGLVVGPTGRGVSSATVNGSGHLMITYTDGSTVDAGDVANGVDGEDGAPGRGIASTTINSSGHLVVTYTDSTTADLGKVTGEAGAAGPAFTGGTLSSALNEATPPTIASSATPAIGAAAANTVFISGTVTITGFDAIPAGAVRRVVFTGALTLTHNGTSLALPTAANILTAAGDTAEFLSLGSGNWRCVRYNRANGTALAGSSSGGSRGVAVSDFAGSDPTGAASSHSQVASAIATKNTKVYLEPGAQFRDDTFSNPMGAEFEGGGLIGKAITGGLQQLNTNADKNQRITGQEYLYAFHNFLMAQYTTPSRPLLIRFSGDSTTAGDGIGAASYFISNLFKEMMYQEGLNPAYGITSQNAGQSGKNTEEWNTTYAAADAAAAPDLLVLRWGVNDGSRGAEAFIASLRAGLATVRAARSWTQTTILLMAPNSTSDTVHLRDEKYYEAIVPGIKQAARDFKCVYAGTYDHLKDARGAANVTMDDPYGDGSAIHPKPLMNVWIAQLIADAVLTPSLKMAAGRFEFRSIAGLDTTPLASALPATYLYGHHIHRATPANGFPVDGTVLTWRSQDGLAMQINYPYKTADQATHWVRYGSSTTGTGVIAGWGAWVDTGGAISAGAFSPVITVTAADRDAALTDVGGYVNFNKNTAKTYKMLRQLASGVGVVWPDNGEITVVNDNNANLTLVADTGVTLKAPSGGSLVLAPDMVVTLKRTAENIWRVIGQTV